MPKKILLLAGLAFLISTWSGAQTLTGTAVKGTDPVMFYFVPGEDGQAHVTVSWTDPNDMLLLMVVCGETSRDMAMWGLSAPIQDRVLHLDVLAAKAARNR